MKEKLIDLFEYTYYFSNEMIRIISENISKVNEKIISLINHTLNAQQIWNSRILNEKSFDVRQVNSFEKLAEIYSQNFQTSIQTIENLDFDQTIEYQNSKGSKFENTIFEILFQSVNHSTYHLGQFNHLLKQVGIEPILTDYIFYKR